MKAQEKLVHNERVKLLATFLNGLGIALFAVGGIAPLASFINGTTNIGPGTMIGVLVCFIGAFALHYVGRGYLKRLKL